MVCGCCVPAVFHACYTPWLQNDLPARLSASYDVLPLSIQRSVQAELSIGLRGRWGLHNLVIKYGLTAGGVSPLGKGLSVGDCAIERMVAESARDHNLSWSYLELTEKL